MRDVEKEFRFSGLAADSGESMKFQTISSGKSRENDAGKGT